MKIIGTKYFGHDAAVCEIDTDTRKIFALSVERYSRIKHDQAPVSLLRDIISFEAADVVAHSFSGESVEDLCWESTAEGAARYIEIAAARNSRDEAISFDEHSRLRQLADDIRREYKLYKSLGLSEAEVNSSLVKKAIKELSFSPHSSRECDTDILMFDHHLTHAMAGYYSSPFCGEPALCITIDGQGDGHFSKAYEMTPTLCKEIGASAAPIFKTKKRPRAASIGIIYSNFTGAAGFRRDSDEGKIEALASFGRAIPEVLDEMLSIIKIEDNSIKLSIRGVHKYYDELYLKSLMQKYGIENYAATVQKFLEKVIVDYINSLMLDDCGFALCLSGGVVANIIMNLAIYEKTKFKKIHIAPFMGDDGSAYGAAVLAAKARGDNPTWLSEHPMPYFGPCYKQEQVLWAIQNRGHLLCWQDLGSTWFEHAAQEITQGKIIALFQGRMEYGPRALGNRSILADPRDPNMREKMNLAIKRRPPWQPFCPSILEEERWRLFEESFDHRHMAIAFRIRDKFRKLIPSAVHIDGTVRPQFVTTRENCNYYNLLRSIKDITGFGVLVNTSFNLHGRAMVMTPEHALDDFMDCDLDSVYFENIRVTRKKLVLEMSIPDLRDNEEDNGTAIY